MKTEESTSSKVPNIPLVNSTRILILSHAKTIMCARSKLVELASEMRQHSGTSVSELKRKYNHLVPSNERVLGLAESEKNISLSEVRGVLFLKGMRYGTRGIMARGTQENMTCVV